MRIVTDQVKIGALTTKNRIAVPPMVMFNWTDDEGMVSERHVNHYEQIAKGGAGFIIVEATAVTKRSRLHETELGLWDDKHIAGFRQIAEAVHKYDVPLVVQLLHAGINGIDKEPESCSEYVLGEGEPGEVKSCAMSKERIEQTIDDFVKAAMRAKEAGLDGVELHGCHSYLLSQFMNKEVNKREDEYGLHKTKLATDIIKAIKQACGEDFVVGIRIAAFEPTLQDGIENAKAFDGLADFLDVSYGMFTVMEAWKPEGYPYKEAIYGAQEIKKLMPKMPVFGVDSITDAESVKGALELTGLDMVDVGRCFLADPSFANHVLEGKPTGKCLYCKTGCHYGPNSFDGEKDCPGKLLFERRQKQ